MPTSILLVGNYALDRQESMQRYGAMLETGLREQGVQVTQIRPEPVFGRLKPGAGGLGKWLGYVDKFILFPRTIRSSVRALRRAGRIPVVHICDHSNAFYVHSLKGTGHVVTCHDLLAIRSGLGHFPENPTGWTGRRLQGMILRGLRAAHHVCCVSQETRRQLLDLGGFEADRSSVIYNSLNYPYRPMAPEAATQKLREKASTRLLAEKRYIFHIGGNQWYKNRLGVINIYEAWRRSGGASDVMLALAGKPLPPELARHIERSPYRDSFVDVGAVDNPLLNALYARAECLLFPSWYEGFGWPVLEARAVGCPVVCTGRPPLSEIAGPYAKLIDPADETAAARAVSAGMAARGRAPVPGELDSFDLPNIVAAWRRLYEATAVAFA